MGQILRARFGFLRSLWPISPYSLIFLFSAMLSSCGPGGPLESPKDHRHEFVVENQSDKEVKLNFDAYYGDYCDRGYVTAIIPPKTQEKVKFRFTGCVNGGGETIDGVKYSVGSETQGGVSYPVSGSKIICSEDSGCNVTTAKSRI
jgi:hypothetical protein